MERIEPNSKQPNSNQREKNEYRVLFNAGCILGLLAFLAVYGARILDFTYDAWLLNGDMDLKQHYIGWLHFRMDRWMFPVGLIDSLSYPINMSVIYTDSIPAFACFFKLFARVLPQKFQYFGLFGLLSFVLQGGISTILVRRFTNKKWLCILSALVFTLSFPVLQRMYYHTALSAQWMILLAFLLWFYQEKLDNKKYCLAWTFMGFLCVMIHSYFLPMAGMILVAALAERFIIGRKNGETKKTGFKNALSVLFSYCIAALLTLYLLGGFYGEASAVGDGLGTFGSNLNTFINSLSMGRVLKALPLYYDFQYEGAGYLGAGILLLLCVLFVVFVKNISRHQFTRAYFREHYRVAIFLVLFVVVCVFSVFPMVTFNDVKLFGVPYPSFIRKVLGIFRSNGRFIWVAVYMLMLTAIVYIDRCFKQTTAAILFAVALLLQLYDFSGMIKEKRDYFCTEQTSENMWDAKELQELLKNKEVFAFMYNENDIIMDTAYYAAMHGMRLTNYYYARDIDEMVEGNIAIWKEELKAGIVRDEVVYIFKEEDFDESDYEKMDFYPIDGHVLGIKNTHRTKKSH